MFVRVIFFISIFYPVTSRILIETINSTNTLEATNEEYFHFSKSYISTHRLIFAKLILLCFLGCFFWICSCQMIIRQIYIDKQRRSKASINIQGNISTIPIRQT
ncbi:unnamed protein product [Rotaria magnacalcarata]|uniref:Uncharacterized protein n=1 Tax=Rotaria magnacalcarata TaxID=392030 RepID=A0A8S2YS99_9BILA|nr:unnamed protein product [Rotaria magnacalcarata]CAF5081851.1 unnamed protein product [Rotaria magnacalcarata]CAF5137147.1 unnamed protein product [Rotaria magnacalcarata]